MTELITTFNITTVVVILLIAIPALINFISWCKKTWQQREAFKNANIEQGKKIEAEAEAAEARLEDGEARMSELEEAVKALKDIAAHQEDMIELLVESDKLNIKCWIKMQHEKWIPRGCIDSQTLDLLEARYKIYAKEGGNSWAEKLMNELRALPTVTVIAVQPTDEH